MKKVLFLVVSLLLLTGCTSLPETEHPPVVSSKYTKDYDKKKKQAIKPDKKDTQASDDSSELETMSEDEANKNSSYDKERNELVEIGGLSKELVATLSDEDIQHSLTQADTLVSDGQLDHLTAFINDIRNTLNENDDTLDQTLTTIEEDVEDEKSTSSSSDSALSELEEEEQSNSSSITPDQAIMAIVGVYGDSPEGAKYVSQGAATDTNGQDYHLVSLIPDGQDSSKATTTYRVYDDGRVSSN